MKQNRLFFNTYLLKIQVVDFEMFNVENKSKSQTFTHLFIHELRTTLKY